MTSQVKDMKLEKSLLGGRSVRVVAGHGTLSVDLGAEEIRAILGRLAIEAIGAGEALAPADLSDVRLGGSYLSAAQLVEAFAFADIAPQVA